jgi:hypothetical protein
LLPSVTIDAPAPTYDNWSFHFYKIYMSCLLNQNNKMWFSRERYYIKLILFHSPLFSFFVFTFTAMLLNETTAIVLKNYPM